MEEENLHKAHRSRVKERFEQQGLDGFEDHQVLELLLFYAIPRVDVNALAHTLMNRFRSLHGVFDAGIDELKRVPGIGENAALLIKLIPQLSRRYMISQLNAKNQTVLSDSGQAGQFLTPFFHGERDEVVYVVCLDNRNKVISCKQLFRGDLKAARVSVRKILELVLKDGAAGVILAHNHPGGSPDPSEEDVALTREIAKILRTVDVTLNDHIIVSGTEFASLYQMGMIDHIG
jgi:DNA repair protein RadC